MRIFNEDKTEEIKEYNKNLFYLKEDKLLIKHHEAVEEVKQVSHLEVFRRNEQTGGVEYKEVIDTPYQSAKEAYDEFEDILVIVPFTEEELLNNELNGLVAWFDGYYRTQVEQYNRCQRTGAVYDKDIVALDKQADDAQKRIREIKALLKI